MCVCREIYFLGDEFQLKHAVSFTNIEFTTLISNCSHKTLRVVIINACPIVIEHPLKLGHRWAITLHSFMWAMMTSSNGNIFRVTGHLCGEFTVPRLSKYSWSWWFETLSRPLWRHRYGNYISVCQLNPILSDPCHLARSKIRIYSFKAGPIYGSVYL